MRRFALAGIVVLGSAPAAHADDRTYSEHVVLADTASVAVLVGTRSPLVGLSGYALLAPAVHVAHGEVQRAAVSLAMGHLALGVVGALAVTVIDAFVVANGESSSVVASIMRATF